MSDHILLINYIIVLENHTSFIKVIQRVRDCRGCPERAVPKEWSREAEPRKARPVAKRAGTPRFVIDNSTVQTLKDIRRDPESEIPSARSFCRRHGTR